MWWGVAATIFAVAVIVFVVVNGNKQPLKSGSVDQEPGLVAQVGDYRIFQSDIDDKIAFEKCLNEELDPTRSLGNLFYFGFLESVKSPLKTDATQAEMDKEYNNLETNRATSFMSVDAMALKCLDDHFSGRRASFDKVVIRPALLDANIQKTFTVSTPVASGADAFILGLPPGTSPLAPNDLQSLPPATTTPVKNVFGTDEPYYDWYTGYLKAQVKVEIFQPQICSDVKALYSDAWFKDLISCQ